MSTSLPVQRRLDAAAQARLSRLDALADRDLSQLTAEDLLGELLGRVRHELDTDTAAVLLLDDSQEFLVASAARGLEEEVRQGSRVPMGHGFAGRIAAERRPVVLDEVGPANVVNPVLLYKGVKSMLGVPMLSGRELRGVLHVGTLRPRVFTEEDAALLLWVAERAAQALDADRRRIDGLAARALQRSLAPNRLLDPVGLELAARYVPGGKAGVGGDWYDCFQLPDGRTAFAMGDVMGHGMRAATVMGRVRAALRAHALGGDEPHVVLRRLDQFVQAFEPGEMVSVLYAVQTPGSSSLVFSSAGHMPPVLALPGRGAVLLDEPEDLMLGVEPEAERSSHRVELTPGGVLCLYTDGLVEQRGQSIVTTLEELCDVLARERGSAESVAAELMAHMVGRSSRDDDVALLVIKREG